MHYHAFTIAEFAACCAALILPALAAGFYLGKHRAKRAWTNRKRNSPVFN